MKNKQKKRDNFFKLVFISVVLILTVSGLSWAAARYILQHQAVAVIGTSDPAAIEPVYDPAATVSPPEPAPSPTPSPTPAPSPTPEPPPPDPRVLFAGDVLLDGSVLDRIAREGLDSVFLPEYRGPFLEADIVMINLEMPISDRGEPMNKEFAFRGNPEHISLFVDMGVDIVSVANNHTLDYGVDAFLDTLDLLRENNIKYAGGGRNIDEAKRWETFRVGDTTIAFLAASRVIPALDWHAAYDRPGHFETYDPRALNAQITLAKAETDFVVVYVHWGVERNIFPEDWQRTMARGYINAGADMVIGAHPHVLQGFEYYNGGWIAYSLGNFIWTNTRLDTAALEFTLLPDGGMVPRIYPYEIVNRATIPLTDPTRAEVLRAHLNNISFGVEVNEEFVLVPGG
ncbi:MAG: CapA family protein [Defluviitaleaceae bacterium]|nr:CapA family protein [Defluviitaleaceae bacterium]